jgi:trimethylamine---corrinoid protein Co-methyltransferase
MKSDTCYRKSPSLSFLTQDQRDEIHFDALELLDSSGVLIYHEEALNLLYEAGAIVEGNLVRIPEHLVKAALQSVPSRIVMANRKGERCMFLESKRSYFGTGSGCPYTIDVETGIRRATERKDIENASKLCDYLPNIDFIMSLGLIRHHYPEIGYILEFDAMVRNTEKPIVMSAHDGKNTLNIIEMARTVMGGSDNLRKNMLLAIYSEATSPLRHSRDGLDKLLICAENMVPVIHTVGIMAGATGPMTMAGSLIQGNAELLSALVIHQLKRSGAPFFYGGTITPIDMRTMAHPYGAPEFHILSSALTEMGAYYKMPIFSTGGCSDAKSFDQQASAEAIYSLLLAALSGGNLVHDIGYIDSGLTSSLSQIAFSSEAIGLIQQIMGGIPFDAEAKALDTISSVGPGGQYIGELHTMNNFRKIYFPTYMTRDNYDTWIGKGEKTLGQVIDEEVRRVLIEHTPAPLPHETEKELDQMIKIFTDGSAKVNN